VHRLARCTVLNLVVAAPGAVGHINGIGLLPHLRLQAEFSHLPIQRELPESMT
jgi:hypothetical protein